MPSLLPPDAPDEVVFSSLARALRARNMDYKHPRVRDWMGKVFALRGFTPPNKGWQYFLEIDELRKLHQIISDLPIPEKEGSEGLPAEQLEDLTHLIAYCDNQDHFNDLKNMGATSQQFESAVLKALTPSYYKEIGAPRPLNKQKQLILQWNQG